MEAASTAASKLPKERIERAVTALLKWKSSKSATQKAQLLESDEFLYLVITLHKIPSKGRTNAYKIPLPNPLYSSEHAEFCLFLDDRHLDSKSAKQKVLDEKIPVAKVIKFSKLKTNYKPFEAKRKLCDSYDLFFADKRIVPLLPKAIGKHFYKKKKIPIPIELGRKNWKEQIERVCGSALLFINTGTCCVVRVARGSMEKEEIVENVVAAVNGVVEFIPQKWRNVRSLHLKFADSVSLPVYQAAPEMKMKFGGGFGAMAVMDGNLSGGMLSESGKNEVSEKKSKQVGKKKGRIHEVRYMDNVGFGEMMREDESGSDDDGEVMEGEGSKGDEMDSAEIAGKKRKNVGGDKEVKKVAKVKKGEKDLKQKKEKVSGKSVVEKKSKKRSGSDDDDDDGDEGSDDGEMGSAEIAVEKMKKGVKNVTKANKGEKGLKQKKAQVFEKSMAEKRLKKSKR
ncbi:hypothetical protein Cgig2_031843 [Carnegiea gigantea]|uniref:Ribosomal L1 domain-containing protein 1 n=1 Tax=Carnegiea gigantea TaxID=171969 RepID=A0A9Q1KSL1_9CARY|nr:hypothetical protein Cgig2_031843 [Carnegiea gigantea]